MFCRNVVGDPVNPGLECTLLLEPREASKDLAMNVLFKVSRLVGISLHCPRKTSDSRGKLFTCLAVECVLLFLGHVSLVCPRTYFLHTVREKARQKEPECRQRT